MQIDAKGENEGMLKYCVCTDAVFMGKSDILPAMDSVKACGYPGIEFWTWWDKDMKAVAEKQKETGLEVAAFCTKFIEPGEAKNQTEYLQGLQDTIDWAKTLNCGTIVVQAGWQVNGRSVHTHKKSILELFRKASEIAERENVVLVLEPLNILVDHPTYFISASKDAFALADEIGSPNFKILFDIYHQQITEGNLIANITENIDKIGHFHAAGNPGRNEITKGEINYRNVFRAIEKTGYQGWIGLEYMTNEEPEKGLTEVREQILI